MLRRTVGLRLSCATLVVASAACAARVVPEPSGLATNPRVVDDPRRQGAFISGFIPGPGLQGYESKVDYKAEPGKRATAVSVNGLVTDRPGDYPFRMALLAEVPGHPDPHQFQQTFNVRVVGAQATGG